MVIIYKDKDIIIIEKPRGMPVHQLAKEESGTLGNMLLEKFPELRQAGDSPKEAGLVHRLDNDTSGILVAARNRKSWLFLREQFRKKKVTKEYLALVLGRVKTSGRIFCYIAHSKKKKNKMIVVAEREAAEYKAKRGTSSYCPITYYKDYTLVRIVSQTGLRHQVRVQLAWLGYPLAGDRLYQNRNQRDKDKLPLTGHFLHATKIIFAHPRKKKTVSFRSELPAELKTLLLALKSRRK